MDLERDEYDEVVAAFGCFQPPSLEQPVAGSEELTIGDALADDVDGESVAEARAMLSPLVRRLSPRDRQVLHLRFVCDRTQQEIGEELGVSQVQVSRWLAKILDGLREDLGEATSPEPTAGTRGPRAEVSGVRA